MAVWRYLGVFTSDKAGPRWREWYGLTDEQKAERQRIGLTAIAEWDEAHKDVIEYQGGPLGPTKRIDDQGHITDVVNLMTVFMVVRADSHEAAVRLFEGHPHMTVFPCDGVEVMPVLGD